MLKFMENESSKWTDTNNQEETRKETVVDTNSTSKDQTIEN